MNWQELRKELERMKREGELQEGIMLNKASRVTDPEKFIESHIYYLDTQERKKKNGERIEVRTFNLHFNRLKEYYLQCKKKEKQK